MIQLSPSFHVRACCAVGLLLSLALMASDVALSQQMRTYPLTSTQGLTFHNVKAQPATQRGLAGLQVTLSNEAEQRFVDMDVAERQRATETGQTPEQLVIIDGLEFGDGVIEAEVAGAPKAGVFEAARGFVGIAFRVQPDRRTYDAFYLRPANGRSNEQVRRNRSVQYISHPEGTWFRFREQAPGKYESYVDLVPGEWTKVRIEVRGEQARLFVHGAAQPVLIVNDLKTGAGKRGAVALWLDVGTLAHFRNLTVTPILP